MLPKFQGPSSLLQKLKGAGLFLFFSIPLALSILLVNALQVCSLLVKPFSPHLFRKINWGFGYFWWGSTVFCMEKLRKVQITFTGEQTPVKENVALIANHQGMIDTTAIFALALRKGRLGQLKWFAKDILKYVPGPGWGLFIAGNFFVKRDWLRDQKNIDRVFARVLKEQEPMWLISFLEGTRITLEKLKRSQQFCIDRKRPVLEHLLAPRTKGFAASIQALRTHLDAVYDVTIAFPEGAPTLPQMLSGYISKMNIHVRRFPIQSLPFSEQEISEWVWKIFAEKDELLKYFSQHKVFPGPAVMDPL